MPIRLLVVAMLVTTAVALGMIAYRTAQPPVTVAMPETQALPAAPAPTAGYLVAARPLPAGTLARDDDFKVKNVAPGEVPPNAMLSSPDVLASMRGGLIRRYLDIGTAITIADVLRPRDRGFLAAVLAPGTRAVSIGVDAITGVAGLIWPGDRVDVILTQEMDQTNASLAHRVISETVLTNIRVIAVDQEIVQGATETAGVAGKVARTVTLQVTPDEAQRLTVGERLGRLALSIRSMADTPEELGQPGAVFGSNVSPALSAAGPRTGASVQLIEGDKRTDVMFR